MAEQHGDCFFRCNPQIRGWMNMFTVTAGPQCCPPRPFIIKAQTLNSWQSESSGCSWHWRDWYCLSRGCSSPSSLDFTIFTAIWMSLSALKKRLHKNKCMNTRKWTTAVSEDTKKRTSVNAEPLYLQQRNLFLQLIFCTDDWRSFQPGEWHLQVTVRHRRTPSHISFYNIISASL